MQYQLWMLPAAVCVAALIGYLVLYSAQKKLARYNRAMRIGQ